MGGVTALLRLGSRDSVGTGVEVWEQAAGGATAVSNQQCSLRLTAIGAGFRSSAVG